MTDERFSLKDHLFNRERVSYLGGLLERGIPGFDRSSFESEVLGRLPPLELKQRIDMIAEVLVSFLDDDFAIAADQIRASLPPPLDPTLSDNDFGEFILIALGKFVEDNGGEQYETSMRLLREITMRVSMEGPVRRFIEDRPDQTLELFADWAGDENYHVRRLVSESTRPRLPWARRIHIDIERPLPLLDILHADRTRYVTRSVANHLNDMAKVRPEIVIETLRRWHELGWQHPTELRWMTRHALRTLIKQGHQPAFALLGYADAPNVAVELSLQTKTVRPGGALEFAVTLTAGSDQRLLIDYVLDFVASRGAVRSKVFKLRELSVAGGEITTLEKRHPLRSDATTYRLYSGTHRLAVVANGREVATDSFEVVID